MITIHRNNQTFGPYSLEHLKKYVEEGKILFKDQASQSMQIGLITVEQILKQRQIRVKIQNKGSIFSQIKALGKELIIPKFEFIKQDLFRDKKLIYLAAIGLAPAFLIRFTFSSYLTFYAIALYFSVIWAIFFFYLFKTRQVETLKTIVIFFLSQASALLLIWVQKLPLIGSFYSLIESNSFIVKYFGFVFVIGVFEELTKALPLFLLIKNAKEPIIPQTLVFYGLMSGIGFGVFEGVLYQTSLNSTLAYNEAFFMNIARLTSLPFLHAIWCGIAGYFIAFANLYPLFRKGLHLLAILIPAILHGSYDVFGWSIIGLTLTILSVLLLVFYLKRSGDYQSKLINI